MKSLQYEESPYTESHKYQEVKFLSLPTIADIAAKSKSLANEGKMTVAASTVAVDKYYYASLLARKAQENMAVTALKVMRNEEWRQLESARKQKVREANAEFRDKALEVFSAICTRGL